MAEARFRRIANDIRTRIDRGEWGIGQDLPSRRDLATEYGVNEQTMRLAYQLLRRTGVLQGEERRHVYVAHPTAVRTLTDVDADWPYSSETTDTRPRPATEELAERLGIQGRTQLRHETVECLDPGGRSAMLVSTWWQGPRRTIAYRVVRARAHPTGSPLQVRALQAGLSEVGTRKLRAPQIRTCRLG